MSFKKCRDLILGAITLALSVFYLVFAQQIKTRPKITPSYSGARVIPNLLGVLLAVLSLILIFQGIRQLKKGSDDGKAAAKGDTVAVVETIAVIIAYTLLLQPLGFCLSTVLFLFGMMMVLAPADKRNPVLFIIVSVVFTAFVFVAFRIGLQQLLPRGIIESLLGF